VAPDAEAMNRRALAGYETALGPEHLSTLTSVYCLAYLLQSLKRYNEALVLYNRACSGYKDTLGLDHPTTQAGSKHRMALVKRMDL